MREQEIIILFMLH